MAWEESLSHQFGLDDEGWARHANPVSGWSRMLTGLPLIIFSAWSRVWIGWWSLIPIFLTVIWLWRNPTLFEPAADDSSWMSRGVLGEKIWVRREQHTHVVRKTFWPHLWNALAGAGAVAMIVGLWHLDPVLTLLGGLASFAFKLAFLQRMVALYDVAIEIDSSLAYQPPQ